MRISVLWKTKLLAEALTSLLEEGGRFEVIGVCDNARDCLNAVRENRAHCVVAEGSLLKPGEYEMLLGGKMLGNFKLVVLAEGCEEDPSLVPDGCDACLDPNTAGAQRLFKTIRELLPMLERPLIGPNGQREVRRGRPPRPLGILSQRETEVAKLVAKGHSNRRIAELTGIQEQSVKNMVSSILKHLECENRTQVAIKLASGNFGQIQ